MYARHFGLQREAFSIAPDPRCLFMSERHREALAHLLYGLQSGGGFVLLTGEIGTGKTTVCRAFLEQVPPHCRVAYVFNPRLTVGELLQTVCAEFSIAVTAPGLKAQIDALNHFLLATHASGGISVLVIDEAQSLASAVLEQLRLLTNLETSERKLLQIILIGQPELRDMLARPRLEQLAQRVVARFHLGALDARDVEPYMRHRLAVAGLQGALPFDAAAMRRMHRLSGGVPRRINLLAGRALLGAYACGQSQVSVAVLNQAAAEVFDRRRTRARSWRSWRQPALVMAGVATVWVVVMVIWLAALNSKGARAAATAASAASAVSFVVSTVASSVASAPSAPSAPPSAPPSVATDPLPPAGIVPPSSHRASAADVQRELAALWGVTLPEGDACEQARVRELQCFRSSTATLATLRQLARPGVVTLGADNRSGAGDAGDITPLPALLLGLGAQSVSLRIGGTTQPLTLAAFGRAWRGDFMSYWRASSATPTPAWLAEQLQRADPAHAMDAALPLATRIQRFQRAQGLVADGVAGAMTLIQLKRALTVPEPRLSDGGR